jgi:peptidoglycan/xylan/chitin deacetylase (PgdA/CDA1 family)
MRNPDPHRRRLSAPASIYSLAGVVTLAFVVAVVLAAPARPSWFTAAESTRPEENASVSMAAQPATGPMTSFVPQAPPRQVASPEPTLAPEPKPTEEPAGDFITYLEPDEGVGANELGRIPILMYHAFVYGEENTDEWTLTFDQFREQLDWLVANDFVMVGLNSVIHRDFDVPAGKKPVVLTFDDASGGQYRLQAAADGGLELNPDTALAILEEYKQEYPEFAGPAFFAVLPDWCFYYPDDNDPATCEERLQWLVDNGYEVGNHTMGHENLTDAPVDVFKYQVFGPTQWFAERISGPNNLADVLVLPYGAYPAQDDIRAWLFDGFWYEEEYFVPTLVLEVGGGPARSPFHIEWTTNLSRYNTDPGLFWEWADIMDAGEVELFVSDGDPDTVTVPEGWEEALNQELISEDGRSIVVETFDDTDD